MSITLESSFGNRIERQNFVTGRSCFPIFDSPAPAMFHVGDRVCSPSAEEVVKGRREEEEDSCSSSSSIGKNSDASAALSDAGDEDDAGENEVQSSRTGSLHSMNALEEVLPINNTIMLAGKCGLSRILPRVPPFQTIEVASDHSWPWKTRRKLASGHYT